MVRWDNIFGLVLILLLGHLVLQGADVLSAPHGPAIRNAYEDLLRPELRPVFWLEMLALACAVVFRWWRSARRREVDRTWWKDGINSDRSSGATNEMARHHRVTGTHLRLRSRRTWRDSERRTTRD